MTDNPSEKKISETSGVKAVLDEAAERIEATWREKLLRETADLRTENALLMAQVDEFSRKLVEARDRNERLEADCNERVAFIEEKFELDTANLELENNELHAASVRYLADARELDRQVAQLHAEAETMVDEIERLRGERDAALKAQAELSDALLAQRGLMAEGGRPQGPPCCSRTAGGRGRGQDRGHDPDEDRVGRIASNFLETP